MVDECDENVTLEANDEGWVEALQAVRRFFEWRRSQETLFVIGNVCVPPMKRRLVKA